MISPFESITVCRSGPVAMSVTLAWRQSVAAGICARTVLTSASYMMPRWSPSRRSTRRPQRATQVS